MTLHFLAPRPSTTDARAIVHAFVADCECPAAAVDLDDAETWFLSVFDMATSAPLTTDYAADITAELSAAGLSEQEITEALVWYSAGGIDDDLAKSIDSCERWKRPA